jgi:hypothetical protein
MPRAENPKANYKSHERSLRLSDDKIAAKAGVMVDSTMEKGVTVAGLIRNPQTTVEIRELVTGGEELLRVREFSVRHLPSEVHHKLVVYDLQRELDTLLGVVA